jgi:hypothetical protein
MTLVIIAELPTFILLALNVQLGDQFLILRQKHLINCPFSPKFNFKILGLIYPFK